MLLLFSLFNVYWCPFPPPLREISEEAFCFSYWFIFEPPKSLVDTEEKQISSNSLIDSINAAQWPLFLSLVLCLNMYFWLCEAIEFLLSLEFSSMKCLDVNDRALQESFFQKVYPSNSFESYILIFLGSGGQQAIYFSPHVSLSEHLE